MNGKTVIITGGNKGIGKETARKLATKGAKIILACRDLNAANKTRGTIIQETGNHHIFVQKLDLSSQKSVRKFAEYIIKSEQRLDVLIHNAGTITNKINSTKDNLELTMATNYFGPFLLTHLLIDLLKKSAPSRIIVVGSITYIFSTLDLDNINSKNTLIPQTLYLDSKYAIMSFTIELARRLRYTGVTASCLHPGAVDTNIWHIVPDFIKSHFQLVKKLFLVTSEEGCKTSVYLASSKEVEGVTGKFFVNCKQHPLWRGVDDVEEAKKLWELSKRTIKLKKSDPKI